MPLVSALMPIPSLAWVPVFILWFGLGNTVAILIVFYAALFPMLLNTWSGVRAVNPLWLRAAGAMGASENALFWKVMVPGASPYIITGRAAIVPARLDRGDRRRVPRRLRLGPRLGDLRRKRVPQRRPDDRLADRDRRHRLSPSSGWCSARSRRPPYSAGAWCGWSRANAPPQVLTPHLRFAKTLSPKVLASHSRRRRVRVPVKHHRHCPPRDRRRRIDGSHIARAAHPPPVPVQGRVGDRVCKRGLHRQAVSQPRGRPARRSRTASSRATCRPTPGSCGRAPTGRRA